MAEIEDFSLQRQDGRTLAEGMGLADIERLGWPPSPIVSASWRHAGQAATFDVTPGSLAQIVAGHHHVAVIAQQAANGPSRLLIVRSDGRIAREVSSRQIINGKVEHVDFGWFEKSLNVEDDVFGVIVNLPRGVTYQLDVEAGSGNVLRVKETR